MFKSLLRKITPNPLDRMLIKAQKKGATKVLLGWNRGLGDIALGLYAICHRIRSYLDPVSITFLIRDNLKDGFTLLPDVTTITAPNWVRGRPYDVKETLQELDIDPNQFDLIIDYPNPTYWVSWQRGHLVPKLHWDPNHDNLVENLSFPETKKIIGVQVDAETHYGRWRNWPEKRWHELFSHFAMSKEHSFLLFGYEKSKKYDYPNVYDLRGKTSLFSLLATIKKRCTHLILPDSGILSMVYYLDLPFPIRVISLWADPRHGILKQNVTSPNPLLEHRPMIGDKRDLSTVTIDQIIPLLS
jgi:ADP-heptose:LPS heptosyltransferase